MADQVPMKVGVNIDIQRTDGRIHSAVISGINEKSMSVTVEWYEKGETKGKEIEMDAILSINPKLLPPSGGGGGKEEPMEEDEDPPSTASSTSFANGNVENIPERKAQIRKPARRSIASRQGEKRGLAAAAEPNRAAVKVSSAKARPSYAVGAKSNSSSHQNGPPDPSPAQSESRKSLGPNSNNGNSDLPNLPKKSGIS